MAADDYHQTRDLQRDGKPQISANGGEAEDIPCQGWDFDVVLLLHLVPQFILLAHSVCFAFWLLCLNFDSFFIVSHLFQWAKFNSLPLLNYCTFQSWMKFTKMEVLRKWIEPAK